jgi:hypothetical protein
VCGLVQGVSQCGSAIGGCDAGEQHAHHADCLLEVAQQRHRFLLSGPWLVVVRKAQLRNFHTHELTDRLDLLLVWRLAHRITNFLDRRLGYQHGHARILCPLLL